MRPRLSLLLAVAALAPACQTDYESPFMRPVSAPIPSAATLLFVGNAYEGSTRAPRELFALDDRGGVPTRLTACASRTPICEVAAVAPSHDRNRVALQRRLDGNRDGSLTADEDDGIYVVDLTRGVEGQTITPKGINGLDWSPTDDLLVYTARGEGGLDDLWSAFPDGTGDGNRSLTPDVRERGFRFSPNGQILAYERSTGGLPGEIWLYRTLQQQAKMTTAPAAGAVLPGTHYVIGADADPDFSPDFTSLVFRRLTGIGERGRGTWDILTVTTAGTDVKVLASGAAYRGAPDWGSKGIVFVETPVGGTTSSLVVLDPFGNRRSILTQAATAALDSPRWLP
jgi:dipeptidyl aminopeptidase/acylaminoacyl peptidase